MRKKGKQSSLTKFLGVQPPPITVVRTSQGPAALKKLGKGINICVVDSGIEGMDLSQFDMVVVDSDEFLQKVESTGVSPLFVEESEEFVKALRPPYTIVVSHSKYGCSFFSDAYKHRNRLNLEGVSCLSAKNMKAVLSLCCVGEVSSLFVHTDSCEVAGCRGSVEDKASEFSRFLRQIRKKEVPVHIVKHCACGESSDELFLDSVKHHRGFLSYCSGMQKHDLLQGFVDFPVCTIVLIDDSEKPIDYLDLYFSSMRELNIDGMCYVQIIVVTQRENPSDVYRIVEQQPFFVEVVIDNCPFVFGYPIWNICRSLQDIWHLIRGMYVCVDHTEFFWCQGRIKKTALFLSDYLPCIALGNLRRFGSSDSFSWRILRSDVELFRVFSEIVQSGDWSRVSSVSEEIPTRWWCWNLPDPKEGRSCWEEDQFFVRKDWLELIQFLSHAERQEFQDIYDLLHCVWWEMHKCKVAPRCVRLDHNTAKSLHLHHDPMWGSWRRPIADWFLSDPVRWSGTSYADSVKWESVIKSSSVIDRDTAIWKLRQGVGGTTFRYRDRFVSWLRENMDIVQSYNKENKYGLE